MKYTVVFLNGIDSMKQRWMRLKTILVSLFLSLVLFGLMWVYIHLRRRIDIDRVYEFNQQTTADIQILKFPPDWLPEFFYERLPTKMQSGVRTPVGVALTVDEDEQLQMASELIEFEKLEALTLNGPNLTSSSLAYLEKMPSLRKLYLFETTYNDDDLKHLASLPYLHELRIGQDDKITGSGLIHLTELNYLEDVCLECPIHPNIAWEFAVQNPKLKLYYANHSGEPFILKDHHLAQLTTPVKWKGFAVDKMQLSEKYLDHLKYCPALRYQYFSESPSMDEDNGQKEISRKIHEIDLSGTDITDGSVYFLAREPGVTKLDVSSTSVSDRSIKYLIESPSKKMLVSLSLKATQITPEGASSLYHLSNLRRLDLSQTVIDGSVIDSLMQCESLEELIIEGTTVTPGKIEELKSTLPKLKIRSDHETK
ncbi:MAG: hypothetical protein KDA65_00935 [Planctomycetaceae bacterium]|nr:hypothetical protein [Planctomycetaceae bacterium]